ncbi:hypothetical protein ACFLWF_00640, partial [Chloroflexota bacterium]
MNRQVLLKLAKSDQTKLVPILVLAFYITFIPHFDYAYAVHIDEWIHIAYSNALLNAGTIFHSDPFTGQGSAGMVTLLELGYHLPFAIFHDLSGISWMDISRYAPSIVFVITVLSVYIFAKRLGFGWEAALFTCLIPTTVGIMGPAFMVPVAMALTFSVIILYLVFYFRTIWSYIVICVLITFLVILHATSAILAIMLLIPFLILGLKSEFKHSMFTTLAITIPFLLTLPWTYDIIAGQAGGLFFQKSLPDYHDILSILTGYGYLPIILCLIGSFVLTVGGYWKNYALVCGLLVMAAMLTIFYRFGYGLDAIYLRGLLFTMLIMGIVAGAGLMTLRKFELPWFADMKYKNIPILKSIGVLLCMVTIGVTFSISIPDRLAEPYYHMIDKADYEAFIWIRDNVDSSHQMAILDPWKATAFTAITGKYVYTRTHSYPTIKDLEAYAFIDSGSTDTIFLRTNDISIV